VSTDPAARPGTHAPEPGETHILSESETPDMVSKTVRDDGTWYECEACGLLFDTEEDAKQHEQNCDAEDPSYLQ
jgi:hypothetical protein